MKIVLVGATGTIGKAVHNLLEAKGHEVTPTSRNTEPKVNIDKPESIDAFYENIGIADAIICAAGNAGFGALQNMTDRQLELGIRSKLLGQVNLVRKGLNKLNTGGIFVLTSGMLAAKPWPNTSAVAMVNAALEGFTRAAALDLADDKRICIISPPLIRETAEKMGRDKEPWPEASEVAKAYLKVLDGDYNGEVVYVKGYEM